MQLNFESTIHFKQLEKSKKKINVFQGGTRSGKTYNILQWIIKQAYISQNKIFSITRQTFPALRSSAMRDFFNILKSKKIYNPKKHNKTNNEYKIGTNLIEFFSLDDEQKVRGRARDYLFINEANECPQDIWRQLLFRTNIKIILDYNPSALYHFIYDDIIPRDDCDFYISTFEDNPFISKENLKEILNLKNTNENLWKIYGLGQKGVSEELIYSNWNIIDAMPIDNAFEKVVYGLDFGFNNPAALIKVGIKDKYNAYIEEIIYETHLLNSELIDKMKKVCDNKILIKADSAEPDRIKEIYKAGFNIIPTKKYSNSVKDGIDQVKRFNLYITKNSLNVIKEIKSYSWKKDTRTGVLLDEPVKFQDHSMDSIRYAIYEGKKRANVVLG